MLCPLGKDKKVCCMLTNVTTEDEFKMKFHPQISLEFHVDFMFARQL